MRAWIAAMLTATLLTGCASTRSQTIYEKAGVGEEQKRADEAQCTTAAVDNADQRGAAFLNVDRDVVDRCMRARGYRVSAPK
jgi:uncharacterized protein YcfL